MITETDYTNNPLTKEQEKQIDALFADYDTTDKPGCSVGVIKDGRFIYKKSYGMANLEHNIPITADSKFEAGSVTKQFTAICIALLQIDGKLDFDDDIRKYIPELSDYGNTITLKHLIFHTSGLMDYTNLMRLQGASYEESYYNNQDVVRQISKIKRLNFKPGEKYQYSNTGYLLLAEIVSRVSGQPFAKYAKERIFDPLKMTNTLIIDNWKQVIKNRTTSYYENDMGEYDTCVHISENVGGIGLISTINDFLLWDQNYYSGKVGGDKLKEIVSCLKRKKDLSEDEEYGLGLGFYRYKSISVVSHDGNWLAYNSEIRRYPEYKTSVIIFFNTEHEPKPLIKSITDIVLADFIIEPNAKLSSKDGSIELLTTNLEIFCGNYCAILNDENEKPDWYIHDDGGGQLTRKIYVKDGNLFYWRNEESESRLIQKSENEFIMEGMPTEVSLLFDITSNEKIMKFFDNGKCSIVYKSYEPAIYRLEKLSEYAGKFYSSELDVEYQIEVDDNKLAIFIKEKKMSELTLIMDNVFLIDEWYSSLSYCFNAKNEITGLVLNSYRAQNIRFMKQS